MNIRIINENIFNIITVTNIHIAALRTNSCVSTALITEAAFSSEMSEIHLPDYTTSQFLWPHQIEEHKLGNFSVGCENWSVVLQGHKLQVPMGKDFWIGSGREQHNLELHGLHS